MDSILWQVLKYVLLHETFVFDLFHIVYTIRLYSEYTLELFEIVVAW